MWTAACAIIDRHRTRWLKDGRYIKTLKNQKKDSNQEKPRLEIQS
jgi:thermostable 8-oxoguanine DNA glycosylase